MAAVGGSDAAGRAVPCAAELPAGSDSGGPLEAAAADADEVAGGAGVTRGTGSARSEGVSPPLSLGVSPLAASVLPSSDGFGVSPLPISSVAASGLALSSIAGSRLCGSSLAEGASSLPGLARRLSRCLVDNLRPSGPRSLPACGGNCPSAAGFAVSVVSGRASRLRPWRRPPSASGVLVASWGDPARSLRLCRST